LNATASAGMTRLLEDGRRVEDQIVYRMVAPAAPAPPAQAPAP
jgi:hypothetical protein